MTETYCSIKLAPYPPKVHCEPSGKRTSNWPPSSWAAKGKRLGFRQPVTYKYGCRLASNNDKSMDLFRRRSNHNRHVVSHGKQWKRTKCQRNMDYAVMRKLIITTHLNPTTVSSLLHCRTCDQSFRERFRASRFGAVSDAIWFGLWNEFCNRTDS